jgi:amicyanin
MYHAAYQPANIEVHVGTMVTWTDQDTVSHTVTFRDGTNGRSMMGSSMMQPGQFFSVMFREPGTYQYYWTAHPSMVATVIVV